MDYYYYYYKEMFYKENYFIAFAFIQSQVFETEKIIIMIINKSNKNK